MSSPIIGPSSQISLDTGAHYGLAQVAERVQVAARHLCAKSLVGLCCALGLTLTGCTENGTSTLGVYQYPQHAASIACEPGTKTGLAGATEGERTARGISYNVRTPANYDPKIAHALLMVYAPAGLSAAASERFTGLTTIATRAGFVVAYSDHVRNSIPMIKELGTIPHLIAKKWCIDERRIYL